MDILWASGCRVWRVQSHGTWRLPVSNSGTAGFLGWRTPPRALQQGSWAPASPSSPVLVEHPGCLRWPLVVLVSASLVTRGVRHLFLGSWATCVSGEVSAQVPGSFLNWVVSLFGCERYFIFQYKSLER